LTAAAGRRTVGRGDDLDSEGAQGEIRGPPGVRITDAAIVTAATLSNRYITDRFLPD
jgi:hypothetical protein